MALRMTGNVVRVGHQGNSDDFRCRPPICLPVIILDIPLPFHPISQIAYNPNL
jgi:hypothetical protein